MNYGKSRGKEVEFANKVCSKIRFFLLNHKLYSLLFFVWVIFYMLWGKWVNWLILFVFVFIGAKLIKEGEP